MALPQDVRAPHIQQRWVELLNVGSFLIPAHGIFQVEQSSRPEKASLMTPQGGRSVIHGKRPDDSCGKGYMVNGQMDVPVGSQTLGYCTNDFPVQVLYDAASTPVPGEEWGPKKDSFKIHKEGRGFQILGDADPVVGTVRVNRVSESKIRHGRSVAVNFAYPLRHANTFEFELGTLELDVSTPGCRISTFIADFPQRVVIAHDRYNDYVPVGKVRELVEIECAWFIHNIQELIVRGQLAQDLCGEESSVATTQVKVMPHCADITIDAANVHNKQRHRGPNGFVFYAVKRHCEDLPCAAPEWHIFEMQMRRACFVVDIMEKPSCLTAAALGSAQEWCLADQPTRACKWADLTDCDTVLPTCSLTVTFDPCRFCCNVSDLGCL